MEVLLEPSKSAEDCWKVVLIGQKRLDLHLSLVVAVLVQEVG